eukprot:TRINITY_DN5436_c2_g1_i1.p1 TRINITY_DN5436_c2_g1~~TRINITY_DN5436_c2_g1_i1.p1  ORF type:complete len:290 (+),score=83.18 TRINITY_DN5436_c2_g1_i1:105-872(+)
MAPGLLRPSPVVHYARHSGLLRPTPSAANNALHYFNAHQALRDKTLDHVSRPGTPNPREKYWWRRVRSRVAGTWRSLWRDNTYKEEIPIVFQDPIPGGHGDRFTHSMLGVVGMPNAPAFYAKVRWERENLTPEQLAAKYGVYVPRLQKGTLVVSNIYWIAIWVYLLVSFYQDDDTVIITHGSLNDFVRDMGGIQPLCAEDQYLEQWYHPTQHHYFRSAAECHWMYKPTMKADVVDEVKPYGVLRRGCYDTEYNLR